MPASHHHAPDVQDRAGLVTKELGQTSWTSQKSHLLPWGRPSGPEAEPAEARTLHSLALQGGSEADLFITSAWPPQTLTPCEASRCHTVGPAVFTAGGSGHSTGSVSVTWQIFYRESSLQSLWAGIHRKDQKRPP